MSASTAFMTASKKQCGNTSTGSVWTGNAQRPCSGVQKCFQHHWPCGQFSGKRKWQRSSQPKRRTHVERNRNGIREAAGVTATEPRTTAAREGMVEEQIRRRGIGDEAVLRAMRRVPRD